LNNWFKNNKLPFSFFFIKDNMIDSKGTRLSKLAKEYNVGISTIIEFLKKKGFEIENNPNAKISQDMVDILDKEYSLEKSVKKESEKLNLKNLRDKKESITLEDVKKEINIADAEELPEEEDIDVIIKNRLISNIKTEPQIPQKKESEIKIVGKINLEEREKKKKKEPVAEEPKEIIKEEQKEPVKAKVTKDVSIPPVVEKKIVKEAKSERDVDLKVVGKIDLDSMNQKTRPAKKTKQEKEAEHKKKKERPQEKQLQEEKQHKPDVEETIEVIEGTSEVIEGTPEVIEGTPEIIVEISVSDVEEDIIKLKKTDIDFIKTKFEKLNGPTVIGRIDLPVEEKKKPVATSTEAERRDFKKKRKRIRIENQKIDIQRGGGDKRPLEVKKSNLTAEERKVKKKNKRPFRQEVDEEAVQKQIKETLARLTTGKSKSKSSKYRKEKRDLISLRQQEEIERQEQEKKILKLTEFVSVSELASMMNVTPTQIITTCMDLGLFVSINQRLDAETLSVVAEEFNYKVEFTSVEVLEAIHEDDDSPETLIHRPPIVTVMGHVDHGKTKLLDHIRNTNVIAGEAGGITQHIGAYHVQLDDGKKITFLDTPGHEAFTAMRARGAQITDIAIIVIAADDGIMPQTIEAINHAQAAGVPMIFAINKIDKPTANPEKIKEELANMNFLVEDWGGKYQSQEISAKSGLNVKNLLEKVLLEAEMLDLKANPNRNAKGTIVESSLDKGRGYTATLLVETGTLRNGDLVLAGSCYGRVKALFNERGKKIVEAYPSNPAVILGLNGAPQAGDKFHVLNDEKEAKDIATKREQLQREQSLRTMKHITLDEIGRRIAIGNFKELNIIVKGDFDGSVEALSDSLIKLTNEEIQINIIHKAVGQISESDVLLATASNAVIIGFQVRPSMNARKLAEKEQIDIRLYSIIYDAIEELKDAMEGMLSPEIKEEIVATLEIREVFKITKVGSVAGCFVKEGKIIRSSKVRVIRDGIVVYTGLLGSLKRFKDDVKEVVGGLECGLNIENFNDLNVGDIIEGYKEVEIKKKL